MLNIIYNLKPFIEDNYEEFGVREYSRILKITAPTASKLLKGFESEGLLKSRKYRGYLLFRANRDSRILKDLATTYWKQELGEVIGVLNSKFHEPTIILFGSLSKLETKKDSDIDLAIFTKFNKRINLSEYEKNLGREIQVFFFKSLDKINKELKMNILNGYRIQGEFK